MSEKQSNSASYWFPRIQAAGLPVPMTILVPFSYDKILAIFDGEKTAEFDRLIEQCRMAAGMIGYPVFVRGSHVSAKHSGPTHYRAENADGVGRTVFLSIEDHELKMMFGPDADAMMVRRFLDLDAPFKAFKDLPIATEFRFFADPERVLCWHPYWPEETIQFFGRPEPDGWREALRRSHQEPPEIEYLKGLAMDAAKACGGAWSVDFCRDSEGHWWLLDMAQAADSYHWPGCPNGESTEAP